MSNEIEETEPTINDLKAQVYDKIGMIEQYQQAVQQLQKEIQEVNKLIAEKIQKAGK